MKGIKFWICLIGCISVLLGCSRFDRLEPAEYESIDQKLYVREYGSGKPIENATITLYQNRTPKYDGYPDGLLVDFASHQTDSVGMVHLNGIMQKITIMAVSVPTPKRYFDGTVYGNDWGRNYNNAFATLSESFIAMPVFRLYPHAWLVLDFDFRKFQGNCDVVKVTSDFGLKAELRHSGKSGAFLVKGNVYHTITFKAYEDGKLLDSWENGIHATGHDTTTHAVTYKPGAWIRP